MIIELVDQNKLLTWRSKNSELQWHLITSNLLRIMDPPMQDLLTNPT